MVASSSFTTKWNALSFTASLACSTVFFTARLPVFSVLTKFSALALSLATAFSVPSPLSVTVTVTV